MTNLEFFLTMTTTGTPEIPGHFWAGVFRDDGVAYDTQYTSVDMLIDFWVTASPAGQPILLVNETDVIFCGRSDSPWDDHVGRIEVPVLNVSAAGGYGPEFEYTLGFLASTDVTNLLIQLHGPEERLLDFGHIDLFTAANAPDLFWEPMLAWVEEHTRP